MCIGGQHITELCKVRWNYLWILGYVVIGYVPVYKPCLILSLLLLPPSTYWGGRQGGITDSNMVYRKVGLPTLWISSFGGLGGKMQLGRAYTSTQTPYLHL